MDPIVIPVAQISINENAEVVIHNEQLAKLVAEHINLTIAKGAPGPVPMMFLCSGNENCKCGGGET